MFWKPPSKEMSDKSLKYLGPPITKWRPCKFFMKLNGNHLLMANIFKLHKYQKFGLLKMHKMNKIWFANNKFSVWKSLFHDKRAIENAILFHYLIYFSKFQMTIVKTLAEKPFFFIMDFEGSNKVLLPQKYFWSTNFSFF